MLLYVTLLSFLPVTGGIFLPELITSDRVPYCSVGLHTHGWLLLYYKSRVYVEPRDNYLRVSADNSGTRLVFKFCETLDNTVLPRGDYCVIKGRSSCPQHFEELSFPLIQSERHQESMHFGDLALCCSTHVVYPISFPVPAPFALVKKGDRCERIANTSMSEVSVKMLDTRDTIIDFCYYDIDPCNKDNGGCEQVCYTEETKIKCSCYPGFTAVNRTHCFRRHQYAMTYESYIKEEKQPGLFTLKRDFVVVTITLAVFLLVLTATSVLLIRLNKIVCVSECFNSRRNALAVSMRKVVRRCSAEKYNNTTLRSRTSTHNFNRDSISAPVGVVAVDLLNRPKSHPNTLQDLRSPINRTSYYVDSPNTMNTDVEEGMYDSLDRRHNNVTMTTSAQYEEPDKDMGANRPLILPGNQSDDQYYLEPDENIPETPLPAYSPSSSTTGQATIATSDIDTTTSIPLDATQPSPPEIYTFNNMYQEPCAKFSVGTLGRSSKKGENNGSNSGGNNGNSNGGNGGNNGNNPHVARIAPIQRNSEQQQQRFGDSLKRNITHNI